MNLNGYENMNAFHSARSISINDISVVHSVYIEAEVENIVLSIYAFVVSPHIYDIYRCEQYLCIGFGIYK